ncbi:cytochrome b/b6 domain-containing protein, partial [Escherichia coli]|nr:cytochrome b/b6 domain-containing protein [Escherichia coli]
RGCNPAYSKSIHTWLRFGEIMRGSLSVMYGLLPLLLLTGLLCLYPQAVGDVFPGVRYWLLQAHFALAFISLFFIFGHLYLCTTGRTPHETFKSMVDGYHRH